jgi:hypothetical protein
MLAALAAAKTNQPSSPWLVGEVIGRMTNDEIPMTKE